MTNFLQDRFPLGHAGAGEGKSEPIGVLVLLQNNIDKLRSTLLGPTFLFQYTFGDGFHGFRRKSRQRARRGGIVVIEQLYREVIASQITVDDVYDAKRSIAQLPESAVAPFEVEDLAAQLFVDRETERGV